MYVNLLLRHEQDKPNIKFKNILINSTGKTVLFTVTCKWEMCFKKLWLLPVAASFDRSNHKKMGRIPVDPFVIPAFYRGYKNIKANEILTFWKSQN